MKKLISALIACFLAVSASAATIYVDANGTGDGSSWADANGILQQAINAASAGDQVWVAKGTYKPTVEVGGSGDRYKTFQMKNAVAIYGGFAGNESNTFDINDRDLTANETILSGDLLGNDTPGLDPCDLLDDPNRADNCYHIFYHPNDLALDPNAILDGFTITAGNANDSNEYNHGGGMYNEGSSPTVTNCTFAGNSADWQGGGMSNDNSSSPTVTNCTFIGNSAGLNGGGMYNYDSSSPTVTNCTFTGNSAGLNAGGMYNGRSSPTVTNCTFSGNSVGRYGGGGMFNFYSSPVVTNCTFTGNSAGRSGGGMFNYYDSSPTVTNCTFTGNSAGRYGGGMYNGSNSSPTVTNCTFSGNSAAYEGGGMYNYKSSLTVTNCAFAGNSAGERGGGMFNYYDSSPTVTNCTFSGNSAGDDGGGMYNSRSSSPTVTNCILWGNTATSDGNEIYNYPDSSHPSIPIISYCDIAGSGGSTSWDPNLGTDAGGNIDVDPLFVDANGPDGIAGTADDNLRLLWGSPCIDAGDNNSVPADTIDLDNDGNTAEPIPWDLDENLRIVDGNDDGNAVIDMGAYEFFLRIEVAMRFTPQAMNPQSKGKWLKARIVLSEGYSLWDVDTNEPVVAQLAGLEVEASHVEVFVNDDGLVEVEAAFERAAFCSIAAADDIVEVTVEGRFTDGHHFYGTDSIKVITRDFTSYLGALASHWLQIGCSLPDWCDGLDIDQDSAVNFVDFSRFDRCCIEVVQE